MHPFAYVMIVTFCCALATLLLGVGTMGSKDPEKGNKLMMMRVGFCAALLVEMLIYAIFIKG